MALCPCRKTTCPCYKVALVLAVALWDCCITISLLAFTSEEVGVVAFSSYFERMRVFTLAPSEAARRVLVGSVLLLALLLPAGVYVVRAGSQALRLAIK